MAMTTVKPSTPFLRQFHRRLTMHRAVRIPVAVGAVVLALALPAAAGAAPSGSLVPPPGCTGHWNTTQSANNNQAPGTAPGCKVAESHVR
jgi:hypothetical protein